MQPWHFTKLYVFLYFKMAGLSTVLGLLFYGFGIDSSTFSDFTIGLLYLGSSLPGMMGFILLVMYGVQSYERKALLQGPHLYQTTFTKNDWDVFVHHVKQENLNSYWLLLSVFVGSGIIASWFNLIPVTVWEGITLGLLLGIIGLGTKYLYIDLLTKVKTQDERCIYLTKEGVLYGPHNLKWTKSGGQLTKVEIIELSDSLSCLKVYYTKKAYSRGTGAYNQDKDVIFPVHKSDAETIVTYLTNSTTL